MISSAITVEITEASISGYLGAIGTDPFSQETLNSGKCRRLKIIQSSGTVSVVAEYYEIWNWLTSSLLVGDHCLAIPALDDSGAQVTDENGRPVFAAVLKL